MSDDKTIAVYEAEAARYATLDMSPDQQAALDMFLRLLPHKSHILDVGCGPGLHAAYMMAQGHTVDAIDATPAFVADALARGVPARLATFDEVSGDALYGGIWASFSLLHAPREDVPRHIATLAAALKPGGTFFLGMKTGEGTGRDALGRRYAYFTEAELVDMLMDNTLVVTQTAADEAPGLSGSVDPYILIIAEKPHA